MLKKCLIGLTIIVILILGLTPCNRAAMEDIFKSKDNISVDKRNLALEELVQKCFVDEEKFIVIVNEGIDDKLIIDFHRTKEAAIVSIVFSKLAVDDSYSTTMAAGNWFQTSTYYRYQWKSKGFLISAVSPPNLQEKLEKLKYTRWWNSAGYFLIFEETINTLASVPSINSSGCSNAYDYLSLAWKYNILSVVFLCREVDGNFTIYSFDPFGHNSAPSPWVKAREIKGRQNHPWILFKWEKYNGIKDSSCAESEIFFDKKKSLNGYPILINAFKSPPFVNINNNSEKSDISKYTGEDGWTVNVIWERLNGKLVEVPLASEDKFQGWIADNGTVRGNLVDIVSGKVDMGMNSLTVGRLNSKTTPAYPHSTLNGCFVTKDKGTIPWLIGLLYVIDNWSMIAGLTVFAIAVVTFGYIDDRRYGSGFLNALRVFISSSYVLRASIIKPKFIISFLFLFPLISYSTIQGKILSLIQNPSQYANIDTENKLLQSGIKFGGPEYMKNFFISPQLIPNYRLTDSAKTCIHDLKKNEQPSACFSYCDNLFVTVSEDKRLHLASEQSVYYPNRYVTRPDFPLIDRFNKILRRMAEVGLLGHYRTNGFYQETSGEFFDNYNNPSSTDTAAATISLEDFSYVFIGIGIGWLSAILVFILELIIGRSKKSYKIIIENPKGISPGLTAESHRIIRRISRKEKWPDQF